MTTITSAKAAHGLAPWLFVILAAVCFAEGPLFGTIAALLALIVLGRSLTLKAWSRRSTLTACWALVAALVIEAALALWLVDVGLG